MRRTVSGIAGAACLFLAGCVQVTGPEIPREATPIPMRELATGFRYNIGVAERQRSVIRSQSEWSMLYSRLSQGRQPVPEVEPVDFLREVVIFASMGGRSSGGYSITIEEVRRTPDATYVLVHERSPGRGCVVTLAFTAPTAAVAVWAPGDEATVAFVERSTVVDCA